MKPRTAFTIVLFFAGLGLLLSGYLSYWNLWGPGCHEGPLSWLVSCGGPKKVLIFGLPTCVYGFFMYLAAAVTTLVGLAGKAPRTVLNVVLGIGILGTLFSGGLTVYELWILKLTFTALPACVYGFLLYAGILTVTLLAQRSVRSAPPPTANVPPTIQP